MKLFRSPKKFFRHKSCSCVGGHKKQSVIGRGWYDVLEVRNTVFLFVQKDVGRNDGVHGHFLRHHPGVWNHPVLHQR